MSYFSEWNERIVDNSNEKEFNDFVEQYYATEQNAYDTIFLAYPDFDLTGTARDLADRLGYEDHEMIYFVGFLDGLNASLSEELDLENLDEETELDLEIDYEKLLYNMHGAQASWLFNLTSWENVFSDEKKAEIGHQYRTDNIAVSDKIGRNEPCPCGSGKKYKKCHGA